MKFQRINVEFETPDQREKWLIPFLTSVTQRDRSRLQAKPEHVCRWIAAGGTLCIGVTYIVNDRQKVVFYELTSPHASASKSVDTGSCSNHEIDNTTPGSDLEVCTND